MDVQAYEYVWGLLLVLLLLPCFYDSIIGHTTSRLTVGTVGADSDGLNLRPPSSFQRPLYVYGLQALAASRLVGILSCGASTTQSLFQSVGFVVCDRR